MRKRLLHDDFGAEILDFDVDGPTTAAEIETLRAALDEFHLLLIRPGHHIAPERHVEIGSWFGPPMSHGGSRFSTLDNEDAAGAIRLPFHSDFSYADTPIKVISLQARETPAGGSPTAYVSSARAWKTLDADWQARLVPLTLRHRHRSEIRGEWPEFVADHPVRLIHPRTGEPILYVTEHHAERICELDPAESDRVLGALYEHLYAPERIYMHEWRRYDLVIWDNIALQHARPQAAARASGNRVLQRVAMSETSMSEMIERARRRQASCAG